MKIPPEVTRLIERFTDHRAEYQSPSYLEARVRVDFINPLFSTLGWDIANTLGRPEPDRDVITEGRIQTSEGLKAPDYIFRTNGNPSFVVEAKKPSVNLRENLLPALQLRRYGWNAKIRIGVLTDFQEFAVYDCAVTPTSVDKANTALVDYYTFDTLEQFWPEIASRFARESVYAGSLAGYAQSFTTTRGSRPVDKVFLAELDEWRKNLASALAASNNLDIDNLNRATHLIINRIVFLRVCEDRQIEPYGTLRDDAEAPGVYERLKVTFERADQRFNSGLFHFRLERDRTEPDTLTPKLNVPDGALSEFIRRLYWPYGPYDFAVLPADILGQVYEQFLGRTIALVGHRAVVQDKPEVRKAGGVYYTPSHIVRDIVASTLGAKLEGLTPVSMGKRKLSVCDMACGSGTFLIEVYQFLLDWHLAFYVLDDPDKWARTRPRRIRTDGFGAWRLTTVERRRILTSHVFGVDIDPQAVEVTKLSLLLKVLEGETDTTISQQYELFQDRVLPDIDSNIKCGNSIVGSAFHLSQRFIVDEELQRKVNAFDWDLEFATLANGGGFDVVLGNPPWLMAGYYIADSIPYVKKHFKTATGKFDLYYVFIEQAFRLLSSNGALGVIVPNKFFHTQAAKGLRELLSQNVSLREVKDFGIAKVFERATNYACIILAGHGSPLSHIDYREITATLETIDQYPVSMSRLGSRKWNFQDDDAIAMSEHMEQVGIPLEKLVDRFATGVQSGSDKLMTFTKEEAESFGLEHDLLRTILRGRDVRAYAVGSKPKLLLFPYIEEGGEFKLISERQLRSDFPFAYRYLAERRTKLAERIWFGKSAYELSGAWYGVMYLERASSFRKPHLLTPALSRVANFARGNGSLFATGTAGVTGLVPKSGISISYLLGLLNSSLFTVYTSKHSPIYQGGFRKFSAPYLRNLPIKINLGLDRTADSREQRIGELAEIAASSTVLAGTITMSAASRELHRRRARAARREIDDLVLEHYGLPSESRGWVNKQWSRLAASPSRHASSNTQE